MPRGSVEVVIEAGRGGVGFVYMTTTEFCASAGLTPREVQNWLENGLLEADMVGRTAGGGLQREFTVDQAERARVLKALHIKGADSFAKLSNQLRLLPKKNGSDFGHPAPYCAFSHSSVVS
jgi:hypothetical protein